MANCNCFAIPTVTPDPVQNGVSARSSRRLWLASIAFRTVLGPVAQLALARAQPPVRRATSPARLSSQAQALSMCSSWSVIVPLPARTRLD